MKLALIEIATTFLAHMVGRITYVISVSAQTPDAKTTRNRFPIIVAQTTEGKIMDGPRGLQLITPCGPTPVDQTPDGFLVYRPVPHILHPLTGRNHFPARTPPTASS